MHKEKSTHKPCVSRVGDSVSELSKDNAMRDKVYKIGISGSYGGLNLGDEAILQSIINQLKKSITAEITVFSRNAADTSKRHGVKAVDVRKLSAKEIKPDIARLDLFILGGGGILYDADVRLYLREVMIAIEHKIPVMLYAVGAGPLDDTRAQAAIKEVLNEVDLITVREQGAQSLLESLGVEKEIIVTADPALLLEPEPRAEKFFNRSDWENKRRFIGISVREPGVAAPDLDQKKYHELIADAADFMVDRMNAEIIFIPMEQSEQDLQHSHAVVSKMLRPQRASVLNQDYTSGQVLSIISELDFSLGMRLHFLIFSALGKIPFVALPYASKVAGFLDALDIDMPPLQLVNAGRLIAYIDDYWDKQEQLKSKIEKKLPGLKERAALTHKLLLKLLTNADIKAT